MSPFTQRFLLPVAAPRAILTRIRWINQNDSSTSFFRFVDKNGFELSPSRVSDALGKAMVPDHIAGCNVLHRNNAVLVDQPMANLMDKVKSSILDPFVNPSNSFTSKPSFRCPLSFFTKPSLNLGEFLFISTKETRVLDLLALVRGQKAFESNVNPDGFSGRRQRGGFHLDRKTNEPFSCRGSRDRGSLDFPFNRTMKIHPDGPDAPNHYDAAFKVKTSRILRPAKRVVSKFSSKPRVARFFLSLQSAEKSLKASVYSILRVLKHLRVNLLQLRFSLFPLREHVKRIVLTDLFLLGLPRYFSDFKGSVVDPTAEIYPGPKRSTLGFRWVQSITKHFIHLTLKSNLNKVSFCWYNRAIHPQLKQGVFWRRRINSATQEALMLCWSWYRSPRYNTRRT